MSLARVFTILRKDIAQGPRSPFFLWILVFPLVISLVIQAAFGAFLERAPTMGVVADDDSPILGALSDRSGLIVVRAPDAGALWRMLDEGDVDMGWVVPPGFEEAMKRGERPKVDMQVGGDALASKRLVLALAATETLRQVHGDRPVVDVTVITAGEERTRSLLEHLLPLGVLFAILLSGIFLPAFSIIDERQKGALTAILVTPTTIYEVMLAKGVMGFVLAIVSSSVTLAMNRAFPPDPGPILVVFTLAAVMVVELGVVAGVLVKNTTMMFTPWKATAWILMVPVATFVWSGFPRWIGMLSPTYWFMKPVWDLAVEGQGLADESLELGVAAAIIVALVPVVVGAGRFARRTIGDG